MKKVIALQDFGTWCRKNNIYTISNIRADSLVRRGILNILKEGIEYGKLRCKGCKYKFACNKSPQACKWFKKLK